jgi:hypothetical protein
MSMPRLDDLKAHEAPEANGNGNGNGNDREAAPANGRVAAE